MRPIALLMAALYLPAAAQQLTSLAVATDGLAVTNPCTNEVVEFSGPVDITARSTVGAVGAARNFVELDASLLGLTAEGRRSGSRYASRDALDVTLEPPVVPWATMTAWKAAFVGPGRERFDAHMTLHVSVQEDGSVAVNLGNVVITCP